MKILLLYFTGTYNTLYITTLLKNQLLNEGHKVDSFDIFSYKKIKFNNYDFVGIGYPIQCLNAPKYLIETLKKINMSNNKYFIYKTSRKYSNFNNMSSYDLIEILKDKNNEFYGEYNLVMPSTTIYKTKEEFVKYLLNYNKKYIGYISKNFEVKKEYYNYLFVNVVRKINKLKRWILHKNSATYKVIKSECIKCRKCYDLCPTHNITYNREKRKYEFKDKCVLCMKCLYICPTNAIKLGLVENYKIHYTYDFLTINSTSYSYDFKKENDKKYKKFKSYFDYIDSLIIE